MDDRAPRGFDLDQVERSVGARFERVVAEGPTRIAVVDKDRTLTYDELNRRANRIARAILDVTGPSPTRVAIYVEKGAECLAAILGVLKAGHAYVPIDPAFPQDRNLLIIENADAKAVLSNGKYASAIRGQMAATLVDLDAVGDGIDDSNPAVFVSPDALAYVIYTSGSTGRPHSG